jgi:sec-independent protein translocase protein TatB
MFGVDTSELLLIAVIALVFIGPKDLPRAMRTVGHWVGKVRGMARHFNSGIEAMVREAELEEMEKQWREENERIMREFPGNADVMLPGNAVLPAPAVDEEPSLPLDEPEQPPPERRPLP